MTATYDCIATTTLTTNTASVTFSSISGSYTDLVLIINVGATALEDIGCQFNSDTGSNYSSTIVGGDGTNAVSGRISNATVLGLTNNAYMDTTINGAHIVNFMNYSNTTTYKTVVKRGSNAARGVEAIVGLWRSTAAISTIYLYGRNSGYLFLSGSTFTLYGIKAE